MTMGTLANGQLIKQMPSPFTELQIIEWLSFIGYPTAMASIKNFEANWENLVSLMRLHLVAIPFENTEMHYSPDRKVVIDPQGLFHRIIKQKNGSYCFGKTGLFLHMLRGLGYRIYAAQGRSNINRDDPPSALAFTPTTHIVLFVQPMHGSNKTYMIDVGYGGSGPVRPILLRDGEVVEGATPTEKHRLTKSAMPGSCSDAWVWQLECFHEKAGQKDGQWKLFYVFDEIERYQVDIDCSSHYVSTFDSGTMHADTVIALKHFWLDEPENIEHRHIGALVLFGEKLKQNMGARSVLIKEVNTEKERVEVLKEYFGLNVEVTWVENIKGRKAALS
ncbi:arylamine n-acetyltransferase 1 [Moniliophthora roreri MCA 2997]|uniref:Tpa: arylamine n-acetyltransferase 1 n=1 Tax=Moniliophthora roreri (strain MCA 2997) TaxID=1381753 RepID=V2YCG5_MONRO|nr:arylamine n-acetyltransferase 1 [Moniliophthora roreri MCA 2997]